MAGWLELQAQNKRRCKPAKEGDNARIANNNKAQYIEDNDCLYSSTKVTEQVQGAAKYSTQCTEIYR